MTSADSSSEWQSWMFAKGLDMSDRPVDVFVGFPIGAPAHTPFAIKVGRQPMLWLAQAAATQLVLNVVAAMDAELPVAREVPAIGPGNTVVPVTTGFTDTAHGMQVTLRTGTDKHGTVILPDNNPEVLLAALRRVIRTWLDTTNGELS